MDKIIPFKGVFFNQKKIRDLSSVVCPPYDVINEKMRNVFSKRNSHNIVRIILSESKNKKNKYEIAKTLFNDWLKNKILVKDEEPCIYLYRVSFKIGNVKKERIGFISLLNLNINRKNKVYPHEHTHVVPKKDRLKLLSSVKANLSPIFVLYQDKKHFIQALCKQYSLRIKPFMTFKFDGLINDIWRITDKRTIKEIQKITNASQLFIADGHHRFEVNKMYLEKMRKKQKAVDLKRFSYCMSYFLDATLSGVDILPIHRVIKNLKKQNSLDLIKRLKQYFIVKEIKNKKSFLAGLKKTSKTIGFYNGRYYLLFLNNRTRLDKMIKGASVHYKDLSVVALNKLVIESLLGLKLLDNEHIKYTHDLKEAVSMVDKKEADVSFLMNPVKIESLLGVAFSNEKMPPKSTFFYPKVLTGLLINKL
ncbi:MAG: DUF1015 domain-containing protein [Candidatus Gygaella obscura]|nr:DUF1015 domain-containing protein [Candidatus Gygaella obscura]